MVSFVLFEKDKRQRELYIKVIKKFLYTASNFYRIYEFDKYSKGTSESIRKIEGQKIYLIDSEFPGKSGIEIAKIIRMKGDTVNPIILFADEDKKCENNFEKNTLILNVIYKSDDVVKELYESLVYAFEIISRYDALTFSSFDEIFRLPYDDIYYIEKNIHDDSVTIFTKDDSYLHYTTIRNLEKELKEDPRFLKTHRSCIINLYNISSYNRKENVVLFRNGLKTDLVCRSKKALLVDRIEFTSKINLV